jgi:hypothetical protein
MAEEPKKGLKAKLAAAGAALSVFGAAPLPAAAAARAAPAAEKPALELKLTESQLKTAAVSAVAVGGAYAILGNKGGSKMLGPGESRSLGHKVLFKGVPPAPALSSGVSIEDKAGMEKVWKQTVRARPPPAARRPPPAARRPPPAARRPPAVLLLENGR